MPSVVNLHEAERDLHQILLQGHNQCALGAGLRTIGQPGSVDLNAWNFVRDYHPEDLVVTVGAGTRLTQISEALSRHHQWLPVGPIDRGDDTIGGAIASGLEGWYRGGHGPLRDRILGMRVVTPALGPIFLGSKVVKNVAGYNLARIFAGTRGALGIITEVTLKVSPQPPLEIYWSKNLSLASLWDDLSEWYRLARVWASLSVVQIRRSCTIYAVWHGRAGGLERFTRVMGAPNLTQLPAITASADDILVSGSIPRTGIVDLLRRWPDNGAVHVETQCGGFFGSMSSVAEWIFLRDWVYTVSGSIRLLRDRHNVVPRANADDPLWRAMKQYYDPNNCLCENER